MTRPPVTASSAERRPETDASSSLARLDRANGRPVQVLGVDGDDALSERLTAAGVWPGAVVERIIDAPFGDPMLFRVQGYRLALRRSEAARVRVAPCAESAE